MAKRKPPRHIDFTNKVTMPIRDMWAEGAPIVFCVDIYGLTPSDIATIPGGSASMLAAVESIGLDPYRYQAWLWDIPT